MRRRVAEHQRVAVGSRPGHVLGGDRAVWPPRGCRDRRADRGAGRGGRRWCGRSRRWRRPRGSERSRVMRLGRELARATRRPWRRGGPFMAVCFENTWQGGGGRLAGSSARCAGGAARRTSTSSPSPAISTSTSMRPCGCSTAIGCTPAAQAPPVGDGAGQGEGGGHPDGPGDGVRGVAAVRCEVPRGHARVAAPALTRTGLGITLPDTSPSPISRPAARRSASRRRSSVGSASS